MKYPLRADVSIYSPGGSFSEVKWIARIVSSPPPPPPPAAVSGERIKWSALNKVSFSSDGHVQRTDGGGGWNAGAVSERVITGASFLVLTRLLRSSRQYSRARPLFSQMPPTCSLILYHTAARFS